MVSFVFSAITPVRVIHLIYSIKMTYFTQIQRCLQNFQLAADLFQSICGISLDPVFPSFYLEMISKVSLTKFIFP